VREGEDSYTYSLRVGDLIPISRHKMRRGGIFTNICCPLNTLRNILSGYKEKGETQPYKYREKIEE